MIVIDYEAKAERFQNSIEFFYNIKIEWICFSDHVIGSGPVKWTSS